MRVISKLAQIDFQFGNIARDDNVLVIESHPESKMRSTVYVSPQDVVEVLKRMLANPSTLVFFLALPFFLYRWRRSGQAAGGRGEQRRRDWPTV